MAKFKVNEVVSIRSLGNMNTLGVHLTGRVLNVEYNPISSKPEYYVGFINPVSGDYKATWFAEYDLL